MTKHFTAKHIFEDRDKTKHSHSHTWKYMWGCYLKKKTFIVSYTLKQNKTNNIHKAKSNNAPNDDE